MRAIRAVLILSILLLPIGNLEADTFPVTKTADTNGTCTPGNCSLREAIGAANANAGADDVPVPAGTYLLTLGQLLVSDDLEIAGAGQESTIIDGNASDRVFEIQSSVLAEISDLTIQNGNVSLSAGGGIKNSGDLILTDSAVSDSTADAYRGGGIHNDGYAALINSTVSGNTTRGYYYYHYMPYSGVGGGISNSGDLILTNSTVSGNGSYYSGGIHNDGYATLINSTVRNSSSSNAAGIFNSGDLILTNSTVSWNGNPFSRVGGIENRGDLTLTNSTVSSNTGFQGGIGNRGQATLTNTTVSSNWAWGYSSDGVGGGILNSGDLTLTNSTVSGNGAGVGGGIWNGLGGAATLTNSTVSGNFAIDYGSGILNANDGEFTLTHTIVSDNSAPTGANCFGAVTSLGYNLTDDTSCGFSATGDLVVADAMLGPLQDNGGPTETHDLLPGSPAIDSGSPGCPPPDTDQRGVIRPQGWACDIGAVEYVPEPGRWLMLVAGLGSLVMLRRLSQWA